MKSEAQIVSREDRIVRWPEVQRLVGGLCRNTVRSMERRGTFPAHHPLTDFTVGWRLSEVREWISGRREWNQGAERIA
jgi:predicted DNA-binding transcriptional regulator AlpA